MVRKIGWVGWLGILSIAWATPAWARVNRCADPLGTWADHLSQHLPLFFNLQQSRAGLSGYTLLVSRVEAQPLNAQALQALGIPNTPDTVAWIYLTTLEQHLQQTPPDQRSFYFRLTVARRQDRDPWLLVRTELLTLEGRQENVSDGLVAQAVRLWQEQGCPVPQDYQLSTAGR
ncbi:MAG: hypothetical protein OHK0012_23390 [Synechococcales cyanobacterium]